MGQSARPCGPASSSPAAGSSSSISASTKRGAISAIPAGCQHVRHVRPALEGARAAKARSPRPNTRTPISRRSTARPRSSSRRLRTRRAPPIGRGSGSSMSRRATSSAPTPRPSREHGDAETFARDYIPTLALLERADLRGGLVGRAPAAGAPGASSTASSAATSRPVARAPQGHGMDYIHIHLVCRKELSRGSTA